MLGGGEAVLLVGVWGFHFMAAIWRLPPRGPPHPGGFHLCGSSGPRQSWCPRSPALGTLGLGLCCIRSLHRQGRGVCVERRLSPPRMGLSGRWQSHPLGGSAGNIVLVLSHLWEPHDGFLLPLNFLVV